MIIRHYLVSGIVQGVGYRQFTLKQALAIGLKGQVRNLRDRRVEIVAAGTETQIRPFEAMLAKGPKNSTVDGIDRTEIGALDQLLDVTLSEAFEGDFSVVSDGELPWKFKS